MGWSQQNANEFPDVYTTRTIQPGDINTHLAFNILMATGTKLLLPNVRMVYPPATLPTIHPAFACSAVRIQICEYPR